MHGYPAQPYISDGDILAPPWSSHSHFISHRPMGHDYKTNLLLLASSQVPYNQAAKWIFVLNFLRATHANLYSIQCIRAGLLNEEKVECAFEHALKVQIQLQKLYNDCQVIRKMWFIYIDLERVV